MARVRSQKAGPAVSAGWIILCSQRTMHVNLRWPPKQWHEGLLSAWLMQVGCQKYENHLNKPALAVSISPIDGLDPATPG